MKKVEAFVRHEKFDATKDALEEEGYTGISVIEVKGHGSQKGVREVYKTERYRMDLLPKIKIELFVADETLDKVVQTIISSSQTGSLGDGKIYVSDVSNAYRIRTGEQGNTAI
ncbi:nitrogen regulatory protein PII [Candidatus Scalindua japonica]|uniref:Nitrogen regulatory protein PII n=1 Tax=Candidatus Scalindua japonica TaxID=1284222 RepID=A0A286U317_9BACT|nr:P-II family nitrogen regulator [Candidatus Scalindua japonica]GAX62540.1 nitrogen regulatory protein PII [Candidatus Scalindua japonica]